MLQVIMPLRETWPPPLFSQKLMAAAAGNAFQNSVVKKNIYMAKVQSWCFISKKICPKKPFWVIICQGCILPKISTLIKNFPIYRRASGVLPI